MPFKKAGIPEISDLNVLPKYRKQGFGTQLVSMLEGFTRSKGYERIGIGVGMTADYGAAQRLYFQLNYRPNRLGLTSHCKPIQYGSQVLVDDDLVLWLEKSLLK